MSHIHLPNSEVANFRCSNPQGKRLALVNTVAPIGIHLSFLAALASWDCQSWERLRHVTI